MKERQIITFQIPGPPMGKGRPRATTIGGHARMYTPAKTKTYEEKVKACFCQNPRSEPTNRSIAYRVDVFASFAMPKSWSNKKRVEMSGKPCLKKPDRDNIDKVICDALNGLAWVDDCQVCEGETRKQWGERDFVNVTISEVTA